MYIIVDLKKEISIRVQHQDDLSCSRNAWNNFVEEREREEKGGGRGKSNKIRSWQVID